MNESEVSKTLKTEPLKAEQTNAKPLNPKIFWRRTFALVATLLLVCGGLLLWASAKSTDRPKNIEDVTLPEGTFDPNAARNAQANGPAECGLGDLEILALTDKTNYGPAENPQLSLSVENKGAKQCYKNLGTAGMVFEVQTGSETVWLSTHCQENADDRYVLLEPGQKLTTAPLEWDRTVSSENTCETERQQAVAEGASYHLLVAVGGVPAQESKQFLLY